MTWLESDHPRNPKDSPNGRGGTFKDKDANGDDFDLVDAYDAIPASPARVPESVRNGIIDGLRRHAHAAAVFPLRHDAGIVIADPKSGRAMLATPVMDEDVRVASNGFENTFRATVAGRQDPAHMRRFPYRMEHRGHVEYRPLPRLSAKEVESLRRGGSCPPPLKGGFDAPYAWTDDDADAGDAVEAESRWPDGMDMDMVPDWEEPPQWARWAVNRVEVTPVEAGVYADADAALAENRDMPFEDYGDDAYRSAFRFYGPGFVSEEDVSARFDAYRMP